MRADTDQVQFVSFDSVYQEPVRFYVCLPVPFPDPSQWMIALLCG